MTDAMTQHRTSVDQPEPVSAGRRKAIPPPLSTTTFIVSGGHLTWLGWTWAVTAVIFAVVMTLIIRLDGFLDSSLWQGAGAGWQRYVIFAAGVTTMPTFLAMFVSNGVTRAQLAASSTVSMVVVAVAGTVFVIAGFVVEALIFGSVGWAHVLESGDAVSTGTDLAVLALRYAVLFCIWFSAGWLIGTGFYRYGFVGGIALIIPFAIPVLVCELLVGQGAASISFDAISDRLSVPAPLGLLVGVGLIAMNATIARAFTRGTAVRSC